MTFTFNPTLATPLDRIRQRIGDTDTASAIFQDETINSVYATKAMNELRTAAQLAYDAAARYARVTEVTVDHQTSRGDILSASFRKLGDALTAEADGLHQPPGTSGYSGIICTYEPDPCWRDPCRGY